MQFIKNRCLYWYETGTIMFVLVFGFFEKYFILT